MRSVTALIAGVVAALVFPGAAAASPPGKNGRIAASYAFDDSRPCGDMGGHICDGDSYGAMRLLRPTRTIFRCRECFPGRGSFSPDGRRIAFASGNGGIYVARANGRARRRLRVQGAQPAWSPGGRWIAYVDADGLLRHVPVRGGRSRPITPRGHKSRVRDEQPSWCPSGRIVYTRGTPTGKAIVSVSANGRGRRVVARDAVTPADCGRRDRVVYSSAAATHAVRSDGTGRRTLFDRRVNDPSLSPDGRLIAYERFFDIFVARVDGTRERQVSGGGSKDNWYAPTWQPRPR